MFFTSAGLDDHLPTICFASNSTLASGVVRPAALVTDLLGSGIVVLLIFGGRACCWRHLRQNVDTALLLQVGLLVFFFTVLLHLHWATKDLVEDDYRYAFVFGTTIRMLNPTGAWYFVPRPFGSVSAANTCRAFYVMGFSPVATVASFLPVQPRSGPENICTSHLCICRLLF